jgi:L-lysine 2,3-aminomutase
MVLDFDHVTGQKYANVSSLVAQGYNLKALRREIVKCVVRCANCHRRRSAQQFGWYAWIPADDAEVI